MKTLTETLRAEEVVSGGWIIFHAGFPKMGLLVTEDEFHLISRCDEQLPLDAVESLFPKNSPYDEVFGRWKTKPKQT